MSEKSKRKGQPQRKNPKLIGAIIALVLLIAIALIVSSQSHRNTELARLDYSGTATQVIASATQTIVALEAEGCEVVEVSQWQITIFFSTNAETDGFGRNETRMNNWLCDDGYRYEHTEFYINIFIDTEDIDYVSLFDEVVEFLEDYPPDILPPLPPLIDLSIIQASVNMIPSESFSMNYNELMEAFDSGLSGAELLEAVATPIE